MLASLLFAAAIIAPSPPLVPGGCTAPAAEHRGEAGCYLLGELKVRNPPSALYWHIVEFADIEDAQAESRRHRWSTTVLAHERAWLYVMGSKNERVRRGRPVTVIGPMTVPPGAVASIRFLVSDFPPAMRTRVHAHPGSEAFYVVDGEQCVETPTDRKKIAAGASYIVQSGLHMQAAAKGRKSLVALILRPDQLWSQPETGWVPSDFCDN